MYLCLYTLICGGVRQYRTRTQHPTNQSTLCRRSVLPTHSTLMPATHTILYTNPISSATAQSIHCHPTSSHPRPSTQPVQRSGGTKLITGQQIIEEIVILSKSTWGWGRGRVAEDESNVVGDVRNDRAVVTGIIYFIYTGKSFHSWGRKVYCSKRRRWCTLT